MQAMAWLSTALLAAGAALAACGVFLGAQPHLYQHNLCGMAYSRPWPQPLAGPPLDALAPADARAIAAAGYRLLRCARSPHAASARSALRALSICVGARQ